MARTRTTKKLAQRIDLNYFKRATPLKRAKVWLSVLAPLIALIWIGVHFIGRDSRVYSSGRLSNPHAVFETRCAACHVQQAGNFSARAENSACLACHDGPIHHAEQTRMPNCAECHVEHRGKIKLSAASNESCAQCHSDLTSHGGASHQASRIRSFEDGHPDFRAVDKTNRDPSTIKLNHMLHMKPIRRSPGGPNVQLDCADCHRSEAAAAASPWPYADTKYVVASVSYKDADSFRAAGTAGLTPHNPASGRELMAPVKFATACAACHLLTFDKRFEEGVPHDTTLVIHRYLIQKFRAYITTHPNETQEVRDPQRQLAGKASGPMSRTVTADEWVSQQVFTAEELLWHKTCSQCHAVSENQLHDVTEARWGAQWEAADLRVLLRKAVAVSSVDYHRLMVPLPNVTPAKTTQRWLPHSRFDHEAHTGFTCTSCHAKALTSTESSDILIPGIANCQTCHAPGPNHAESRCFECHAYHDWSKRKEVKPTFTLPALHSGM